MTIDSPILQYKDLLGIATRDNGEDLVIVQHEMPDMVCEYIKQDMVPLYGKDMYLRTGVVEKLKQAQELLKKEQPAASLKLAYAYRHPDVQNKYFTARKEELRLQDPTISEDELVRRAHLLSASPDVAGHPTGGCVDITITNAEGEYDMGTTIADFSDHHKIRTFYEGITDEQKTNRMILRDIMMDVGFAPFDGEWWHYSYGDKEWARYYEKEHAIYGPTIVT